MKKIKIFAAAIAICSASLLGYNAYSNATMTDQEKLIQANLDALTSSEYHQGTTGTNWQTYTVTCTTTGSSYTESSSGCINCGASISIMGVQCSVSGSYCVFSSSTTNFGPSVYKKDVCGSGSGFCLSSAPNGDPCAS